VIELADNNLCPSYPTCVASIGNQNISKCHFPDIYDLSPDEPISGQMVTLTGINFGSPFDATTVNFYQNEQSLRDFFLKHHRLKQNYLSGYLLF
jgi:hypothetical protein